MRHTLVIPAMEVREIGPRRKIARVMLRREAIGISDGKNSHDKSSGYQPHYALSSII